MDNDMSISIQVNGITEVKGDLLRLPDRLETEDIRQMSAIAERGVETGAASHSKSGALFQSIYNRSIPKGREVGHDPQRAPHALFVVFGTRPHKIRPKNKKALRWAGAGGFIFSRLVYHPGYIGDDYMKRAADNALRQFDTIVTNTLKES